MQRSSTSYLFGNINNIDLPEFEKALYGSELFTAPATSADAFTDQFVIVVTRELDAVAALQTRNRRRPKSITKWFSPEAVGAKRKRRSLERR